MNSLIKRFLSLFLVLTLVLSSVPVALAAEVDSKEIKDLSGNWVNPMYQQYANVQTVPTYSVDVATYDSMPSFSTVAKAGAYVRDQMEARNTAITFQYQVASDDYVTNLRTALTKVAEEAWKHTGVPTEGDYLHWQIIRYGWGATNGEYLDCDTVRFDVTYNFEYFTTAAQEKKVTALVDDLVDDFSSYSNNYKKVCAIYDYLCDNVTYDYDNLYDDTYYLKHSAYAAIVNKTSVCQGYALLFYRLALELGIDARFIGSIPAECHCWNIVQLGNRYYNLDATWDAGYSNYRWFLLGSNNFYDHTRDSDYKTTAFKNSYPTSTVDFTTGNYSPSAKLSGSVTAAGNPKLSWTAVNDAAKYQIYRSTTGKAGSFSLIKTVTNKSFTNTDVKKGTTYYYKVRAVYSNGLKSEFSGVVKLTAKLATPEITLSLVASSGKPKISWDKVTGANKYYVFRSTTGKDGSFVKFTETTGTSIINATAVAGQKYYYKVKAVLTTNTAANSELSGSKYVTCDCAQPVVKASNVAASGKIKLTWAAVDGADGYEVYRSTSKNGTYSLLKTVTGTSFTNTGAVAGKMYYYKVKAVISGKSAATSAFSAVVSRTCDCAQPVVKASNVAASGKIKLTWSAVDGADTYEVYRATSKDGTYSLLKTVTGTSFTNTGAVAGKTYYYKVKALKSSNSAATSVFSAYVSRACDLARPEVTISLSSAGKPKLTWSAVEGADEYEVYRATSKDGTYTLAKTLTGTSYTNTGASAGKTYYYKVMAIDANKSAANSAYSIVVSVTSK